MGSCQSSSTPKKKKKKTKKAAPEGGYSWEHRAQIDRSQYMVSKRKAETVVKAPGSVDGNQFVIEECVDVCIYVFDVCTNVTIDECERCTVFIGACDSSVFARNCRDCKFLLECQQFRARDLAACSARLHCATEPVLEVSPDLRLACLDVSYGAIQDQHMRRAGLERWSNRWSECHNFTPEHAWTAEHLGGVAGGTGSRNATLDLFMMSSCDRRDEAVIEAGDIDLTLGEETEDAPPALAESAAPALALEPDRQLAGLSNAGVAVSVGVDSLLAPMTVGITSRGQLGDDATGCVFAFVVCSGGGTSSGACDSWERKLIALSAQESSEVSARSSNGCWLIQSRAARLESSQASGLLGRLDSDSDAAARRWFEKRVKQTPDARVVGMEWRSGALGGGDGGGGGGSEHGGTCLPELRKALEEACGSSSSDGPNAWFTLEGAVNCTYVLTTFFDAWREQI